jgi:hypothetical protein
MDSTLVARAPLESKRDMNRSLTRHAAVGARGPSAPRLMPQVRRHRNLMRRLTLLLFPAIFMGCQFSENRYLARQVTSQELVGTWRATEFAIKSLRDVGVRDHLMVQEHTLVLRADGSCSVRTIMNMPVLDAADYRSYDTGCRWRLGHVAHQTLEFDLRPAPSVGPPYYYFDEEDGRLLLWQYATDPDARRYMEFEKSGA